MGESTAAETEVVLYTRHDCCLCEDARAEIDRARARRPFRLSVVDVDGNPDLAQKYGQEVPVVVVNGRKAFKFRLTAEALLRRIEGRPWWALWRRQRAAEHGPGAD